MSAAMRFGLVGTGFWARETHLRGLIETPGIEVAGVWGRDPVRAAELAAAATMTDTTTDTMTDRKPTAYDDPDAMFADVDAVVFAVPPAVQADLAVRAARAGCHLLLEKPTALTVDAADAVASAVAEAQVASVVFVTARFQPRVRRWLSNLAAERDWTGGSAQWLSSSLITGGPFDTPWRRAKGGLWDLGPHVLSVLMPALGPVMSVVATGALTGTTTLDLVHAGGARSEVTLSIAAAPDASGPLSVELTAVGAATRMPLEWDPPRVAVRLALEELIRAAETGVPHPCDAAFGRETVAVLAEAERQLAVAAP